MYIVCLQRVQGCDEIMRLPQKGIYLGLEFHFQTYLDDQIRDEVRYWPGLVTEFENREFISETFQGSKRNS